MLLTFFFLSYRKLEWETYQRYEKTEVFLCLRSSFPEAALDPDSVPSLT